MNQFHTEHFILLTNTELEQLVSAKNRDDFQPGLKSFLYATRKLKELRHLAFPSDNHNWIAPVMSLKENGEIHDHEGNVRGKHHIIPLPTRPGEPQMALSYDWLWNEFCNFLHAKKLWAFKTDIELIVVSYGNISFSLKDEWENFFIKISSKTHLEQSLGIFLNNKTLFKSQAKPWDSKDIPIISEDMAQYLIHYYQYGRSRKKHFKQNSIPKAIADLKVFIQEQKYEILPLKQNDSAGYVKGGDFSLGQKNIRCAGCSEIIFKKDGLKRLAIFLKDSDERPQSGRQKDDLNTFCKRCIATVFLCPVKLAPETLTIRFAKYKSGEFSTIETFVEKELKKYVAQTLHVHAGNYISLHLNESIDRKPLSQIWGAYHYALWKMAVTFPPELFAQNFNVEVYPGEEKFFLHQWSLWFVSSLAAWDNVFNYRCYKNFNTSFSQFLRLVSRKKIFQAFYVLISGGVLQPYIHTWKINQLQDIWSEFEIILSKEKHMPIPDYPKIAGFAGLLLPLAERVQSGKKPENEKKRAIGKLLEEADRPIQYAYTASRESGAPDFIFCKKPRNRYFFEKAVELLKWAGEDVKNLKKEGERIVNENEGFSWARDYEQKIFISPDQIARVTSALVSENEKPYQNEADWRAFAYQVKLALWSMFPQYLGPQEKK